MNENELNKVVVRFPPSPTGYLHVGNLRTFVFNYLWAKKNSGKIIFRSEDTDIERSKREYEEYIKEVLTWLGMGYDEFYRQSERKDVYREYLQKLLDEDKAYISKEEYSPEALEEGKELRNTVIRFRNPNKVVTFNDVVLGEISVDTTDLGDFVIAKDLDYPLYHFVVVVDDYLMGVTHVIRGADHVANTPRQILIGEAIGAPHFVYAHAPLVLGSDGKKLSKRHAAVASLDYKDMGYLPDAFLNFMALTGWNLGTQQEVFTREQLIEAFDIVKIQKSPAIFNEEKLRWINREHLKLLSGDEQKSKIIPLLENIPGYNSEVAERLLPELLERISTFGDIETMKTQGEIGYFFNREEYDSKKLIWKNSDKSNTQKHLETILRMIEKYESEWNEKSLKETIFPYAEENGRGDVLWPLRYALSGKDKSPDPFSMLYILGKEESIHRIQIAIKNL